MYSETVNEMKAEMKGITGIGLTTDALRRQKAESYIFYTAHYITEDRNLKSKVLGTHCFEERHTAENLAKDMELSEEKWGINNLLFRPIYVHDNASNATKAPKMMQTPRLGISCLAHAINLAASSATSIDEVSQLITKGRKLVGTFRRSTLASNVLKMKQELLLLGKQYRLLQDCPTRWNSSCDMLERLNELSQVNLAKPPKFVNKYF